MLTPKEQFRLQVLSACADLGMTLQDVTAMVKAARDKLAFGWNDAAGAAKTWMWAPIAIGATGLAGGAALGAGAGHMLAKATEPDPDPEEAKKQELIAAYQQQTQRMRRAAARVSYRPNKVRAPELFRQH